MIQKKNLVTSLMNCKDMLSSGGLYGWDLTALFVNTREIIVWLAKKAKREATEEKVNSVTV